MNTLNISFIPPHCPHRTCLYFLPQKDLNWFSHAGSHSTLAHGEVPRFRCRACEKTFSRQTFDLHYYGKRRLDWEIMRKIVRTCCSDRAMARTLKVSPTTIANKMHRLSQWSLAHHTSIIKDHKFKEQLCADGFETFTKSQYYPGHLNLLVGSSSQFTYSWDYCTIRRKGKMTPAQRERRAQLEKEWKPAKGSFSQSFSRGIVKPLKAMRPENPLSLTTDEHPVYFRVINKDEELVKLCKERKYIHIRVNSKEVRNKKNPLFPVNYMDREIRKDLANHVRETTRHAREPNSMLDRMNIYLVDHNLMKRYRIKARKNEGSRHWKEAGFHVSKVKTTLLDGFLPRPWRPEDLSESFQRMWNREVPGPKTKARDYLAGFWLN